MTNTTPTPDPARASLLRGLRKLNEALDQVPQNKLDAWVGDNLKNYLAVIDTIQGLAEPHAPPEPPTRIIDVPALRHIEKQNHLIP